MFNSNQNLIDILKEKFALKADDSFTVEAALKQIKKALYERKKCNCPPYSHLIIDFDKDPNIAMLRQISARVKELYTSYPKADTV